MWSASSSTVTRTSSSRTCPCFIRSSSRPGQATTMSVPRVRADTCGRCPTPPKMVVVVSPAAAARGRSTSSTWVASSRVGTRTRPRGRDGRDRVPVSRATRGRLKARVLPLPRHRCRRARRGRRTRWGLCLTLRRRLTACGVELLTDDSVSRHCRQAVVMVHALELHRTCAPLGRAPRIRPFFTACDGNKEVIRVRP